MDELDALVRRADEDRWLASRFAPMAARARLIAVYALNYEIARTAEAVTQEAIGDIRLAWWREAAAEIFNRQTPRAHPVLQAFAAAAREADLPRAALERLIEARSADLDAAPFATWADLDAYVDATAGGVMRLAVAACGEAAPSSEAFIREAARAWGYVGLLRAAPHWRARGRSFAPRGENAERVEAALRERALSAHAAARRLSRDTSSALFPAFGYVALAPLHLQALERGRGAPLLARQLRLIAASALGRI